MQETTRQKQRNFLPLLVMLMLFGLFIILLLGFESSDDQGRRWVRLPVSIRASAQADYSRDSEALVMQPVNESIFWQIMQDLPGTGNPEDRISTLQVSLSLPVPTMTLNPQMPTSTLPPVTSTSFVGSTTSQPTVTPQSTSTATVFTQTATPVSITPSPVASTTNSAPPPVKRPRPTRRPKPPKKP